MRTGNILKSKVFSPLLGFGLSQTLKRDGGRRVFSALVTLGGLAGIKP